MTELERISRALCAGDGHDPDVPVLLNGTPQLGAFGRIVVTSTLPQWTFYENYVRGTLATVLADHKSGSASKLGEHIERILAGGASDDEQEAVDESIAVPWRERYGLTWNNGR